MLTAFLNGAIVLAAWAIAFFFFRFKKSTGDRLFGYFAAAFFLMGVERIVSQSTLPQGEGYYVYLIRLLAFLVIAVAIVEKNRKKEKP